MSQQKVCQPLVCAISHRGSSLSCWNTVKKTIFPGKLPGPGLSTPAERAQVSCSRAITTNINTPFKFMSNRPVVVQNECHPYLPAREVRSICKENEIVFQVYIMSHILLHLFSHVRLNPFSGIISCEQAYASLGAGLLPLLEDSTITSIATRLAVTPGQVT